MKTALKIILAIVIFLVLIGAIGFGWARSSSSGKLSQTIETHAASFAIPAPLSEAEVAELTAETEGVDLGHLAEERARERGRHLVQARYGCMECHGANFGGGVMVDDPMLGTILGPNITAGRGGRTAAYTAQDWDRIVRHGVKPDGTPGLMPSEDFQLMSDQELSDIVTYIRSVPEVDNEVPAPTLGPLGTVLMAMGALPLSADLITDHQSLHASSPPATMVSADFGRHLSGVCTGCHGPALAGGPIAAGDPSWGPAANLTPHDEGLAGWTYDQFATLMRTGTRPDGTQVIAPMTFVMPYAKNMTDVELQAIWTYLQSLPAKPTGT